MDTIYLDHAAATPLGADVMAAMQPYFAEKSYNPSAAYSGARQVRADIDAARRSLARHFGARPAELIFTAGGTEANNLAIRGIMERFPAGRALASAIEHDSVLGPVSLYDHSLIPVTEQGIVDLSALEKLVDDHTVLVSVMYANNEIGTIQPLREIGRLLARVRDDRRRRGIEMPVYFHSDAAQAGNYLDLQAHRLGVDLMTINGGKIYGPKQSGLLYVRAGTVLSPLLYGGGQEQGLRSGTENVPAIIGLSAALDAAQAMRHDEVKRLTELRDYFVSALAEAVPQAVMNGSLSKRLPNNIHITLPGHDNERILFQLDEAGILAAAGSACSASSEAPSHVLAALGYDDAYCQASLRFTSGRATTKDDVRRTVATLASLVTR